MPKSSPLPPSSAASSAERAYLHKLLTAPERRHMRVEGVRVRGCVPYRVPYLQRAELCARALGAGGAQGQSVLAGDSDDVEVEIACPQCDVRGVLTPASGRGVSGSQMVPHRGDAREGLREGEGGWGDWCAMRWRGLLEPAVHPRPKRRCPAYAMTTFTSVLVTSPFGSPTTRSLYPCFT